MPTEYNSAWTIMKSVICVTALLNLCLFLKAFMNLMFKL